MHWNSSQLEHQQLDVRAGVMLKKRALINIPVRLGLWYHVGKGCFFSVSICKNLASLNFFFLMGEVMFLHKVLWTHFSFVIHS